MSKQRVLLHNLSIDYTEPSVGLFDFDQNALFFAEAGDIVVTRKKVAEAYLAFLAECGISHDAVTFVTAEVGTPADMKGIFHDESIVKKLRTIIDKKINLHLDNFILTENEAEWASKIGITYEGNPLHESFGGKSFFRATARKNKFPVAFGFENQMGVLDGAIKACLIFLRGFSEVIVKYDEGSVALDSRRFTKKEFLSQFANFEHFLGQNFLHQVTPKFSRNFAIEGWYENTLLSPSVQLYVTPTGSVEIISTHVQLFYGDNRQFKGCLSANFLEDTLQAKLATEGIALATVFAKMGYRGNIAFDAIILPGQKIIWEELNPRKTMTSYSFQIRKRIFGEEKAAAKYYISQYIEKPNWKGKTIEELLEILTPILFSQKRGSGILPFNYGSLASEGRVVIIAFSDTKEYAQELFQYVADL